MKRIIIQIIIFLGIIGSFSCDQSDIWGNGNNPLDKTPPFLSSVVSLSNTSVEVTFSEDVDESSAEEVSNYTIPDLAVLSAERNVADNSIVTLTTSSQEVQEYTITVANVEDLNSNIIGSPNSMVFTGKPLLPEVVDVVSISNTDVKITFSKELEQTSAETAANYSITDIASVVLDVNNADQHYSDKTIVYLTTDAQSGVSYSLSVINVQDNSGNMIDPDNSFSFAGNGDIAPEVRSVIATSNTSIRVVYSEDVEQATGRSIL
ncbi:MAG: Ig-like domain-containing protein [Spirochaetota bacterium]|nr:Ig-like domain-containing protein [Spirochaetota bacterium]